MNEFDADVVAVLRAEADEAEMKTDTAREAKKLEDRLDEEDRARRSRIWALAAVAAVAVVLAAVGIRALSASRVAEPAGPAPSATAQPPMPFTASGLTPTWEAQLPGWTAYTTLTGTSPVVEFAQADCSHLGGVDPCTTDEDLKLRAFTLNSYYRPDDGPTVTQDQSYSGYVQHLAEMAGSGYVTYSDRAERTVDGRRATVMSLAVRKDAPGALGCTSPAVPAVDCMSFVEGRNARLAVIDHGAGNAPTVVYLSLNGDAPDRTERFAELDRMLDSIAFR